MQTEISSQEEFDSIKSKFGYSEYRKFSKVHIFNRRCRLKPTGLDIDVAFKIDGTERKEILVGMETGLIPTSDNRYPFHGIKPVIGQVPQRTRWPV